MKLVPIQDDLIHTPEQFLALLRAKLQGETVKSVRQNGDYTELDFTSGKLLIRSTAEVHFTEAKPL
jgi:hypothetical protein